MVGSGRSGVWQEVETGHWLGEESGQLKMWEGESAGVDSGARPVFEVGRLLSGGLPVLSGGLPVLLGSGAELRGYMCVHHSCRR